VVGGVLLQTWKLPPSLEEVVMFHHNPGTATRYPGEAAIIHVADIIAHSMELGSSGEQFIPPLDEGAWDQLGLQASVIPMVEDQIDRMYKEAIETILSGPRDD
jgi:HD-like signal output (HDOD) protein